MAIHVPLTVTANAIRVSGICYKRVGPRAIAPDITPDYEYDSCYGCEMTPTPTPTPTPTVTYTPTPTPTPTPIPAPISGKWYCVQEETYSGIECAGVPSVEDLCLSGDYILALYSDPYWDNCQAFGGVESRKLQYVGGPYDDEEACLVGCSLDHFEWVLKSDGVTQVAVYQTGDSNKPPTGYDAWIVYGGVFVVCEYKGRTGDATTGNPCSLPTTYEDIRDFGDSFTDNSRNVCLWDTVSGAGPTVIVEQNQRLEFNHLSGSAASSWGWQFNRLPTPPGNWQMSCDWTYSTDIVNGDPRTRNHTVILWLNGYGAYSYILYGFTSPGGRPHVRRIQSVINGTYSFGGELIASSGKFRIRYISGTLYMDYDVGGGWVNHQTRGVSGSPTGPMLYFDMADPSTRVAFSTIDNFAMTDI